jgi:glutaredoxin 3
LEKPLADVVLYTKPGCPYCIAAMALLEKKGVAFTEIVASNDPAKKQEMIQRSNGRMTFPQIFINGTHVGGSDDLHALDRKGELDPMLAA